jgi:hypothetical protein
MKPEFCTCCGKQLTGRIYWLELDQRTQTYCSGGVPPELSQGGFPFGVTCAMKQMVKHETARRAALAKEGAP